VDIVTDASSSYRGDAGARYYEWQRSLGDLGAALDAWKFLPAIGPGDIVVDFGCGGGAILAALPAAERIGVEPNPAAREDAVRRGLTVVAAAAELDAATADVVISNHALEHTLDPLSELRHLHRALKPSGRIVLAVPSEHDSRPYRPGDVNHHLFTWTPLQLGNLLAEAGFESVDARLVHHAWRPWHRRLLRWPRLFRAAGAWTAWRHNGRQVIATARKP
jgi:SAM-dependent methyltransferase